MVARTGGRTNKFGPRKTKGRKVGSGRSKAAQKILEEQRAKNERVLKAGAATARGTYDATRKKNAAETQRIYEAARKRRAARRK